MTIPRTTCSGMGLSRLMLGTVQFGLDYGIANRTGQPSLNEVRAILACAHEGGINCLDTAHNYAQSEEILGRALSELDLAGSFTIVTKLAAIPREADKAEAERIIEASLRESLRLLRLETLPLCLFHLERNAIHLDILRRWRERGLVRRIGVSMATPETAVRVIESGGIDAVQIPCNLFDHRFIADEISGRARREGIAVFARSAFLQGLLALPDEEILPNLRLLIPIRDELRQVAARHGLSLMQLAARFVINHSDISCALVGVETLAQMRQNLELFAGDLAPKAFEEIAAIVQPLPEEVLTPYYWTRPLGTPLP